MANSGPIKDETGYVVFWGGQGLNQNADITAPVESYEPNGYGLYNMAGNVNEWVQDVYVKDWNFSHDLNPDFRFEYVIDSVKNGNYERVIKGGGWSDSPAYLACSMARPMRADSTRADVGFRVMFHYINMNGLKKKEN